MNHLYLSLYVKLQNLMSREEGQDLVEYALLVSLIALAVIAGVGNVAHGRKQGIQQHQHFARVTVQPQRIQSLSPLAGGARNRPTGGERAPCQGQPLIKEQQVTGQRRPT